MDSAASTERSETPEDREIRNGEDGSKLAPRPICRSIELELAQLHETLGREEETLVLLREASERVREALAHHELPSLTQVIETQARWVNHLAELEEQRAKWRLAVAEDLAFDASDQSLCRLSDYVGAPWRERLLARREAILRRVEEIANLSRTNRAVLEAFTSLTQDGIAFLASAQRIEDGYEKQGRPSPSFRRGISILDTRA